MGVPAWITVPLLHSHHPVSKFSRYPSGMHWDEQIMLGVTEAMSHYCRTHSGGDCQMNIWNCVLRLLPGTDFRIGMHTWGKWTVRFDHSKDHLPGEIIHQLFWQWLQFWTEQLSVQKCRRHKGLCAAYHTPSTKLNLLPFNAKTNVSSLYKYKCILTPFGDKEVQPNGDEM